MSSVQTKGASIRGCGAADHGATYEDAVSKERPTKDTSVRELCYEEVVSSGRKNVEMKGVPVSRSISNQFNQDGGQLSPPPQAHRPGVIQLPADRGQYQLEQSLADDNGQFTSILNVSICLCVSMCVFVSVCVCIYL